MHIRELFLAKDDECFWHNFCIARMWGNFEGTIVIINCTREKSINSPHHRPFNLSQSACSRTSNQSLIPASWETPKMRCVIFCACHDSNLFMFKKYGKNFLPSGRSYESTIKIIGKIVVNWKILVNNGVDINDDNLNETIKRNCLWHFFKKKETASSLYMHHLCNY